MPFDDHSNFGYSSVQAPAPGLAGTSLIVEAGHGALFPTAPFNCTVWPSGVLPLASNAEIVRVTAVVGDTLSITRAQEGTSNINIEAGFQIANTTSNKVFTDIETAVTAAEGNITTLQNDVTAAEADIVTLQGDVAGKLAIAANLGDVANAATSRQNLGVEIGVDVQAQSQPLQDISDAAFAQGDIIYRNATNLVRLPAGTSGQFFKTLGAGANPLWADVTGGGGGGVSNFISIVRKAADQTVTNNATPQNDTELFLSVAANTFYQLDFRIIYSGNDTLGDYRANILFPTLANIANGMGEYASFTAGVAGVATVTDFFASTTVWPGTTDMIPGADPAQPFMMLYGKVVWYNTNAGTVQWRFSNVAAGVGRNSITRAGSMLKLTNLTLETSSNGSDWTNTVVKTADQTVTDNSTLQDDTELFVALETQSYYLVEAVILTSGNNTTADYKWQFSHPNIQGSSPQSAAVGYYAYVQDVGANMTPVEGSATAFPNTAGVARADGADSYYPLLIRFGIRTTGVAGNLQYRFANNVAGASRNSITRAGSMLRIKKIWP